MSKSLSLRAAVGAALIFTAAVFALQPAPALAQAAGVLGFKSQEKKPKDGYLYYFVGADEVRLKRPVVPGDQLILQATIVTSKRGIYKFQCTASVGNELVGSAIIMCAERKNEID